MPYLRDRRVVLLVLLCFGSGCAGTPEKSSDALLKFAAAERRCGPPSGVRQAMARTSSPSRYHNDTRQDENIPTLKGFSSETLEIAETIGAIDLVAQIPALEGEMDQNIEGSAIRLLRVRQQLSDRIVMAILDVARTAAEADCEEERADQLADRLQEIRDKKIRYRTLIAIVGDALVGVMAGGLGLALQETASEASAIFGGVVATTFGFAAAFTGGEHDFRHARNILKEVWEGPAQSTLIPVSVWRFLNRPLGDDSEHRSFRETLISQWQEDGRLGKRGSDTEQRRLALFFGEGGIYEIEDLRSRASMLDLLEADVNLMSEHLQLLMREVLNFETEEFAAGSQ